jgi:peptidase E
MKIIIVGEFLYDIYEKALSNAFTKLGCSVVNFAYSSKSSTIFLKYLHKIEFRLLVGPTICLINIKLILLSKKTNPDLIILYRATSIWQMTISRPN